MTADRPGSGSPTPAGAPIDRANEWGDAPPRMGELRHVHGDHDPRAWHWFARGPRVAADGGRRAAGADDRDRDPDRGRSGDRDRDRPGRNVEDERLRDVSHVPIDGDRVNRVWDRGEESPGEPARVSVSGRDADADTDHDADEATE